MASGFRASVLILALAGPAAAAPAGSGLGPGSAFGYRDEAGGGESRKIEMEGRYTEEYRPPAALAPPDVKYWYDHPGPPEIGMGAGISFFWPDLGGVYQYIGAIENVYRSRGYPIPDVERRLGSMNMAWYAMRFWYWRPLAIQLDIGSSTGADIKINGLAGAAEYFPAIPTLRWLRPYAAAGLSYLQFKSVVDYDSAVYPERITASGSNWGVVIRQGVQLWPPSEPTDLRFSASLYLEYLLSPAMTLEHKTGVTREASFQGRSAGLRVEIVI